MLQENVAAPALEATNGVIQWRRSKDGDYVLFANGASAAARAATKRTSHPRACASKVSKVRAQG
jgi:hypothetical protein